jgi:hypothetical protein
MNIHGSPTTRSLYPVLWACTLFMLFSVSCASTDSIPLASFTENSVAVSIWLEPGDNGSYQLSARFTPPAGFHLYSKDIPRTGVDGLGRPTLLELPGNAKMQATGQLTESVAAEGFAGVPGRPGDAHPASQAARKPDGRNTGYAQRHLHGLQQNRLQTARGGKNHQHKCEPKVTVSFELTVTCLLAQCQRNNHFPTTG